MEPEVVAAPVIGTPEYDAAMVAKVDDSAARAAAAAGESLPPASQRPENVPEEYWDADKGAVNTEALLAALAAKDTPAPAPSEATTADAKAAVEATGVDYSALQSEYETDGALSDATYTKLASVGFDRATVDSFIAGQEALGQSLVATAHAESGGPENFAAMTAWARSAMTPAEINAFNNAVGGSKEEMLLAVRGLKASYENANGRQPNLLGGRSPQGNTSGYASRAEMTAEIRDPRYSKDPAFRARVQARIGASEF